MNFVSTYFFLIFISLLLVKPVNAQRELNFFEVRKLVQEKIAEERENFNERESDEDDNADAKFKRWEKFVLPRVSPQGKFYAPDAIFNTYRQFIAEHKKSSFPQIQWTAIGPMVNPEVDFRRATQAQTSGVGRMNCLAQHPTDKNTLYVGTMGGGIWKTVDAGIHWVCLDNYLPSMSISSIAIDPNNPETLYVATGDAVGNYVVSIPNFHQGQYSCGIIKSTDGGTTWKQTSFNFEQYQAQNIYKVQVDPLNSDHIIIAAGSGLHHSLDAGDTWTSFNTSSCYDVIYNPLNPKIWYALTNSGSRVQRSDDGGNTFVNTSVSLLTGGNAKGKLSMTKADTSKVYVIKGGGQILVSNNNGRTFPQKIALGGLFSHQGDYDKAIAISPVDSNYVLVGLIDLIKSVNGAKNFKTIDSMHTRDNGIHVDFHELQFSIHESNVVYACNDGGIWVSQDTGNTWKTLNHGMNITQFYKLGTSNLNPDMVLAGAQDNSSLFFDGKTWYVKNYADGMDCLFDKSDERISYVATQYGNLTRSDDRHQRYATTISPPNAASDWEAPYILNPLDNKHIYFGGNRVYYSYNRGDSWNTISPVLDAQYSLTTLAITPADTNVIYASSYRNIFVTQDIGKSWININNGLPLDSATINDVEVSQYNSQEVYVALTGFSNGNKVYKSIDGGASWENISGSLPNVPCNTIAIQENASHDIYAGTDFGVFFKNDSLKDWEYVNTGMPGVIVSDLEINPRNSRLYAATHGRGVFYTPLINPIPSIKNDAGVTEITYPKNEPSCDTMARPLVITLTNYGSDTLKTVELEYSINQSNTQTKNWSGLIEPFGSIQDTVILQKFLNNVNITSIRTQNPNGMVDDYPLNDDKTNMFTMQQQLSNSLVEGFETTIYPPKDWFQSSKLWRLSSTYSGFGKSKKSIFASFFNGQYPVDYLYSLRVQIPDSSKNPILSFSRAHAQNRLSLRDSLIISISTDCGNSWTPIYTKAGKELASTTRLVTMAYTPTTTEWKKDTIYLKAYANEEAIFRFEAWNKNGNNLYLDDINISSFNVATKNLDFANIQLVPNPAHEYFEILDPEKILISFQLFDCQGRLINEGLKSDRINIENLSSGIYYVQCKTKNGFYSQKLGVSK